MTFIIIGLALVYGSGIFTGWHMARLATHYMLKGNSR